MLSFRPPFSVFRIVAVAAVASLLLSASVLAQKPDPALLQNPLLAQGIVKYHANDLTGALTLFRRAVARDGKEALAHQWMAFALLKLKRPAEAERAIKTSVTLKPVNPAGFNLLGAAREAQGKLKLAIYAYERATQQAPNEPNGWYNLGKALMKKGDNEGSLRAFLRAERFEDPAQADTQNNLGIIQEKLGRLDQAIARYQRAVELDPNSAVFARNLGLACLPNRRWETAKNAFQQATQLNPQDYHSLIGLSEACRKLDDAEGEGEALQRALQLRPTEFIPLFSSRAGRATTRPLPPLSSGR